MARADVTGRAKTGYQVSYRMQQSDGRRGVFTPEKPAYLTRYKAKKLAGRETLKGFDVVVRRAG